VLAVGNLLRGDDGAAPAAVEGLALPGAEIVVAHQLLPEHAALVASARRVVFVDAREDGAPGEVREEPVVAGGTARLSHHLAPADVLALAVAFGGRVPPAVALSVNGAAFSHGQGLSHEVTDALPLLRDRIRRAAAA
jgi:hydrogenase maturation protease